MTGVYAIINLENNKLYVGSAKDMKRRWRKHRWELSQKKHHSLPLQRAWDKYGEQAFLFTEVEHCTEPALLVKEQWYLDFFKPWLPENGYNVAQVAEASMTGRQHSPATKKRLSEAHKGNYPTNKTREKLSIASKGNTHRLGCRDSEETKQKKSIAHKGRHLSLTARRKVSESRKGKPLSEAHKQALKEAHKHCQCPRHLLQRRAEC